MKGGGAYKSDKDKIDSRFLDMYEEKSVGTIAIRTQKKRDTTSKF